MADGCFEPVEKHCEKVQSHIQFLFDNKFRFKILSRPGFCSVTIFLFPSYAEWIHFCFLEFARSFSPWNGELFITRCRSSSWSIRVNVLLFSLNYIVQLELIFSTKLPVQCHFIKLYLDLICTGSCYVHRDSLWSGRGIGSLCIPNNHVSSVTFSLQTAECMA